MTEGPRNCKEPAKSHDPKIRCYAALERLESFTETKHSKPSLLKIIHFAKKFLSNTGTQAKLKEKVLHQALDDVERFLPIISKNTSDEGKQLALKTLKICKRISEENSNPSLNLRLKRFLKNQFFLEQERLMPTENTTVSREDHINYSGRITDIFRMKAITLIKNHAALFPSNNHTFYTIRETPIYAINVPKENKELTLEQKFSPFPGETVIVRGSFKYGLPENFALTTESIQTGFPYPIQHNGWALANPLIPRGLMRPQYLPALSALLEKKESIAEGFLNRTSLIDKSREIWQKKIEYSQKNKLEFISLHQTLAEAIVESCPKEFSLSDAGPTISRFFSLLENQKSPFGTLEAIYRELNDSIIQEPYNFLYNSRINQTHPDLFSESPKKRAIAAKRILTERIDLEIAKIEEKEFEPITRDYIKLMAKVLSKGCINIILQYFSETLECAPPQLNKFEKALQSSAFRQQESFFCELEESPHDFHFSNLKKSLDEDTALFQAPHKFHPLCQQLEKYYISRFIRE